jgi:hypothetical protein
MTRVRARSGRTRPGLRRLRLSRLGELPGDAGPGRTLLTHKQLVGDVQAWAWLIARYGGNGLALKVVGETIRELFGGEIGSFRDIDEASASGVFGAFGGCSGDRSSTVRRSRSRCCAGWRWRGSR